MRLRALLLTSLLVTTGCQLGSAAREPGSGDRALEGRVPSRIGSLTFDNGYPTDATVDLLYDELDFQRGVQAYLWALPLVEMAEWRRAQIEDFGAGPYDFVTYDDFVDKQGILTANATTPYIMAFPDLRETGPLVLEIPAGPTAGGLLDFWQRPVTDLGQTGPHRGQGGRFLILGPGHEALEPAGYTVVRSPHWHVFIGHRILHPDPTEALALRSQMALYPYASRDARPETRFLAAAGRDWAAHQPRGLAYFQRMADILEVEPVEARDLMIMATLRPLGIGPGMAFEPDERVAGLLEEAGTVGEAMARAISYQKRFEGARLWPGKRWERALFITDTDQDLETHTQLDERASWFYEAIGVTDGMMGKTVGAGQVYLEAQKDSEGRWLDGGQRYRLTIPADAPMRQFWSITVYDNDTRCFVDSGELPDKSSRMDLAINADGSVDLYFGPEAPQDPDHARNWIRTVPGEGWFTYFRLYAPTEAYFDQSWQLPDIERLR